MIRMTVRNQSHCFISVYQKDKKLFNVGYDYSYIRFMIGRLTENGIEYVGGKYSDEKQINIEKKFPKGEYLIIIEVNWMDIPTKYKNLVLSKKKKKITIFKIFNII